MSFPLPQPARAVLAARRVTHRQAAARVGVSPGFLGRCLNGYVPPSPRLRAGLSDMLGVPEAELFRPIFDRDAGAELVEAARQLARRSAVAQGLPEQIADPDVLRHLAAVLANECRDDSGVAS